MEQKIKNDSRLGARLKALRLAEGFHVTELACHMQLDGCEVTRETLVKIESGKRNISILELQAIKKALNLTYDQIFEDL